MTTGELIQLLAQCLDDLRVMVDGYEEGYDDLERHLITVKEIRLDAGEAWWESLHRNVEDTRTEGHAITNTLVLRRSMKAGR